MVSTSLINIEVLHLFFVFIINSGIHIIVIMSATEVGFIKNGSNAHSTQFYRDFALKQHG